MAHLLTLLIIISSYIDHILIASIVRPRLNIGRTMTKVPIGWKYNRYLHVWNVLKLNTLQKKMLLSPLWHLGHMSRRWREKAKSYVLSLERESWDDSRKVGLYRSPLWCYLTVRNKKGKLYRSIGYNYLYERSKFLIMITKEEITSLEKTQTSHILHSWSLKLKSIRSLTRNFKKDSNPLTILFESWS